MYDYGWRFYDPALGRFHKQDRFAEKFYDFSPYNYAANNPIFFIDFMGDSIVSITRQDNKIMVENSPLKEGEKNFTNTIVLTGQSVKQSDLADKSVSVVNDAMIKINDTEVEVTSGKRTPEHQARIMFNNLEGSGEGKGIAAQLSLYGNSGDDVIQTYMNLKFPSLSSTSSPSNENTGTSLTSAQIKAGMLSTINRVGPSNVSKHCSGNTNLNVFDINPGSVSNIKSFQNKIAGDSRVSSMIKYPQDPGIHIVIDL